MDNIDICKNCEYYYAEPNLCMYGEPEIDIIANPKCEEVTDTIKVNADVSCLGICYKCGDTNGPWTLHQNGWLCVDCEVKENGKSRQ